MPTFITLNEAKQLLLEPLLARAAKRGEQDFYDWSNLFTNLDQSNRVFVFQRDYFDAFADWWAKYKFLTKKRYRRNSGMCERGVDIMRGRIQEALWDLSGDDPIPDEVRAQARSEGHELPEVGYGDFQPGFFTLFGQFPNEVNQVKGTHATAVMFVQEKDGTIRAFVFEWQNEQWTDWRDAVDRNMDPADIL